jgi:hypothetical protein
MRIANLRVLVHVLSPLSVLSRQEEDALFKVDPDCASEVKVVLERYIKPYFTQLTEDHQHELKNSLAYYLTAKTVDFERVVNSMQECAFRSPTEPRNLFVWLWGVLFPGEDYVTPLDGWKEINSEWARHDRKT